MKSVNLEMSCCRSSNDMFHIDIRCMESGTRILDIDMTPHDFSMWITGRHLSDVPAKAGELSRVGKTKVRERRTLVVDHRMSRGEAQAHVEEHGKEDGWLVDSYMGSQSSIVNMGEGVYHLNYAVYKFVESQENQE